MCCYRLLVIIISDMYSVNTLRDKMSKSRLLLLYSTNYIFTKLSITVLPKFIHSCVYVKLTWCLREK